MAACNIGKEKKGERVHEKKKETTKRTTQEGIELNPRKPTN
jgi:hypothetical protein